MTPPPTPTPGTPADHDGGIDITAADVTVRLGPRTLPLAPGTRLLVGRGPDNDLVVTDPRASWAHARLDRAPTGEVVLTDLDSTNGTFVDGTRTPGGPLTRTSHVHLGAVDGVELVVTVPGAPASEARYETMTVGSGQQITIGRDPANALVLDDPLVSRHHAVARHLGDGFEVRDLGSLNGMQLDGVPTEVALLREGNVLTIGRSSFEVVGGELVHRVVHSASLVAQSLSYTLPSGRRLIDDVSFTAANRSLIAVIGPSGAGKSTLLKALTGSQPATAGRVLYDGADLYRSYANLRQRIGVVPQDDVVHRQLTVRQALGYAAELRLPDDYTDAGRAGEVDRVMRDLELTAHADTPISRLSGGQRKRASVAMELLTQPDLLLLDEPTSGLDPNLDRQVMALLRDQADGGRTVLVVTHSVASLDICDAVLILAPGGKVAYFGPPQGVLDYFGVHDYADVFRIVDAHPDEVAATFAAHPWAATPALHAEATATTPAPAARQSIARQWSTCMRRQARVVLADRSYAVATLVLPLFLAAMALAIPGSTGFGMPPVKTPGEPSQLLVITLVGAAFMGLSASIRELVGERPIFLRERAVGLSPTVYLLAKVCVLVLMCAVQSVLLVAMVRLGKPGPQGAVLLGSGTLELMVAVFGTALASAAVGLLLSSIVGTNEQAMPALVIAVMFQLVMCGGLIQVSGRTAMEAVAALSPSRWGYAQGASTIDLQKLNLTAPRDHLFDHTVGAWVTNGAVLALITLVCCVGAVVMLHRRKATT